MKEKVESGSYLKKTRAHHCAPHIPIGLIKIGINHFKLIIILSIGYFNNNNKNNFTITLNREFQNKKKKRCNSIINDYYKKKILF